MTTRTLAAGWEMLADAVRAFFGSRCSDCTRTACYVNTAASCLSCDSPACVEAMGVFSAEPVGAEPKANWVNDVLDQATRTVASWPAWMRRPEMGGGNPAIGPTPGPVGEDAHDWESLARMRKRDFTEARRETERVLGLLAARDAEVAALKVALDEAAGLVNMMDGQVVLDLMVKYPQGSQESRACSALFAHIHNARDALTRYAALKGTR